MPFFSASPSGGGFFGEIWLWTYSIFLTHTPIVYMAILIAVVGQWALYKTTWGLRLRALGEHPRAADTVGINVTRGRYSAVIMSGALGGLAGANLSLEQVGSFTENMTNGRGDNTEVRDGASHLLVRNMGFGRCARRRIGRLADRSGGSRCSGR
jgi:ABC-type glucose/galactose transport system permease subunit